METLQVERVGDGVYRITLNEKQLEVVASRSLLGLLVTGADRAGEEPAKAKKVILVFPQTSLAWREKHGGPDILAIPEYTIPSIIEDVIWFREHGIEVIVEQPTDFRR